MSTILLIDDDPVINDLVTRLLNPRGHQITWAKHGIEALELLDEANPPDLVLCDLSMPHMDGRKTLETIRSNPAFTRLPVVIFTAHNQLHDLKWADSMSTLGYIIKPFRPAEFVKEIEAYLPKAQPG